MSNCVEAGRMGSFCLGQREMRNNPEVLSGLFASVVIVKAEPAVDPYNSLGPQIRYWAYSEEFDRLKEGDAVGEYVAEFSSDYGFTGFRKLTPKDERQIEEIKRLQLLVRDVMGVLATAPLKDDVGSELDVAKVKRFLEDHKEELN